MFLELLALGKIHVDALIGFLTEQRGESVSLKLLENTTCQSCSEEGEMGTFRRFFFNCPAYARLKKFWTSQRTGVSNRRSGIIRRLTKKPAYILNSPKILIFLTSQNSIVDQIQELLDLCLEKVIFLRGYFNFR